MRRESVARQCAFAEGRNRAGGDSVLGQRNHRRRNCSAAAPSGGPMLPPATMPRGFPTGGRVTRRADNSGDEIKFREAKEKFVEPMGTGIFRQRAQATGGNISRAAERVGMYRQSFQQKMRELGISVGDLGLKARGRIAGGRGALPPHWRTNMDADRSDPDDKRALRISPPVLAGLLLSRACCCICSADIIIGFVHSASVARAVAGRRGSRIISLCGGALHGARHHQEPTRGARRVWSPARPIRSPAIRCTSDSTAILLGFAMFFGSAAMLIAPVAILRGDRSNVIPGRADTWSAYSATHTWTTAARPALAVSC